MVRKSLSCIISLWITRNKLLDTLRFNIKNLVKIFKLNYWFDKHNKE